MKRPGPKKRKVGWTLPLENDPLYPFPKTRVSPDTTTTPATKKTESISMGRLKIRYRYEDGE